MTDNKQIKIRLSYEEADIIAKAIGKQPGDSLALALKKYFKTKDHTKRVQNDGRTTADS